MLTSIADAFDSTNRPNDKLLIINKGVLKVESRNCVDWFWVSNAYPETPKQYKDGWADIEVVGLGWVGLGGLWVVVVYSSEQGELPWCCGDRDCGKGGQSWGLRHGDLHGLQHFLNRLHRAFVLFLPTARHLGEIEREGLMKGHHSIYNVFGHIML